MSLYRQYRRYEGKADARTEQERQRAEQERQPVKRLEAYLRSQGIDPNDLPQ